MQRKDIRLAAGNGAGGFDCYVVTPDSTGKVPAIVLASAIHGVDADLRAIADEFAAAGYLAAAPDLFSRTVPGPLARGDERSTPRGQPRLQRIKEGEADMADTLAHLRTLPQFNGRAVAMGFCYGGPFALIGPKRVGYAAGVSCHGTQLADFAHELDGVKQPVCLIWGDQDHAAPPPVRALFAARQDVELHIFPGVQHGYMMPGGGKAFSKPAREFSMGRALSILQGLR